MPFCWFCHFFSSSLHCLVSFSYGLLFCSLMEELMFLLSLQDFFKYFPQIWFSEHKFIQTISITKVFFLLKLWSLTSLYIVLWIGNCYLSDLKIPRASFQPLEFQLNNLLFFWWPLCVPWCSPLQLLVCFPSLFIKF